MNYQEWQHGGREFIAPIITEEGDTLEIVYCSKATGKRVKLMNSKVACLQLTNVALVEHGMGVREIAKGEA